MPTRQTVRFPETSDLFPQTRTEEELRALVFQIAQRSNEPFRQLVSRLVGDELSEADARVRWAGFVTHRRELAATLGRPVHLRVAALDLLSLEGRPRKRPLVLSATAFEQLWSAATTDGLTGLFNAHHFKALLSHELQQRAPQPLTVASLDLDGFKSVNDTYGHAAGDRALRAVAAALKQVARRGDVVGRLGGDEFALMLIGSPLVDAKRVVARAVERLGPLLAQTGMGLSFGFAQLEEGDSAETLLERADASMYRKKRARKKAGPARAEPARPLALYATASPEAYFALHALFAERGVLLAPAPSASALEALRSLLGPRLVLVHALFPPRGGMAALEAMGTSVETALVVPRAAWRARASLRHTVLAPDRDDGVLTRLLGRLAPEPLNPLPQLASKSQAGEVMRLVSDLARGARVAPARLAELASLAEVDLLQRSLGS